MPSEKSIQSTCLRKLSEVAGMGEAFDYFAHADAVSSLVLAVRSVL